MILGENQEFASPGEALKHFGVKGMRWGVRKKYEGYQKKVHEATPGAIKTSVTTKTGEVISVEKQKPGPIQLAVAKLTKRPPENNLSAMVIRNSKGEKVGSFQVWRDSPTVARGEWLEIKPSAQGRGYSKAAIEGLILAAKNDPKLEEVRLQVPSNAAAAKHIYSGLGFKKAKDLGYTPIYGNLEDWSLSVKEK